MRREKYKTLLKTLAAFSMVAIFIMCIFNIAIPYRDYLSDHSNYKFVDDQFSVATRMMDDEEYDNLKKKRSYLMGVSTRSKNKVHDAMLYSSFSLGGASMAYTSFYIFYAKESRRRKYTKPEDYPFNPVYDEECEKEGRYN